MIKRISVLLLAAMLAIMPGCADSVADVKNPAAPDIVSVSGNPANGTYYYVIDKRTGVVYLSYEGAYRHAITVMLNPDGLPVTVDQLGISYER